MEHKAACPKCREVFPSLQALYAHWQATGHVEMKRSDEEIKAALDSIEGPQTKDRS